MSNVSRHPTMRPYKLLLPLVAVLCAVLAGCNAAYHSGRIQRDWVGSVPAPELVDVLKTALIAWPSAGSLDASTPGRMRTSWKTIPGKRTGVLWWERKWEARVSYLVLIERDFGNPATVSSFRVTADLEERPNDSYPWEPAEDESAAEYANQLRAELVKTAEKAAQARRKP